MLTDNQMIREIRQTPKLDKLFERCSPEQRRQALRIAEGETWHLDEVLEFVLEEQEEVCQQA